MRGAVGEFQRMLKQLSPNFQLLSSGRGWELTWHGEDNDKTAAEIAEIESRDEMAVLSIHYGMVEIESSGEILSFDFGHCSEIDPVTQLEAFVWGLDAYYQTPFDTSRLVIDKRPRGSLTEIDVVVEEDVWWNEIRNGVPYQTIDGGEMQFDEPIRTVVGRFTYDHALNILTNR